MTAVLPLCILCAVLGAAVVVLSVKLYLMRESADDIRTQFAVRLSDETNVGIDISSADKKMRCLAADLDIQLKRLRREQIRYTQGDQELKEAVTNISHDLRTPLTAICGYLELLRREDLSDTVRAYLAVIGDRIDTLTQLTEELFRYSIVLSVRRYEARETVSLSDELTASVAAYYGALREKGITPDIHIPEVRLERTLNKTALSRIFDNILSNAIKYSAGDLSISLTEDGNITFRNRAPLLDEVTVGQLFDRFFTVETGNRATGLGLSIARVLTEEMGGEISADYQNGILSVVVSF